MTTRSRPVAARAMRMASMVASVPELAKRTWSRSNRRHSSSATATVTGVGAAKWVPVVAARVMASTMVGWACPQIPAPKPPWKSMYSWPSTSHTLEPWPRSM